jgi:predicted alpha/beta-fold hydrolase
METNTKAPPRSSNHIISEQLVRDFLSQVASAFATTPFQPHPVFSGGHAQTLVSYAWPRRYRLRQPDEERVFEIEHNVRVLAHCRWQTRPLEHPTIVLWHGIEGSSSSIYMLGIADKAFRIGFNIVRVNLRNCGFTEHLTPTLYHGGLSEDLRAVVSELIDRDGLPTLFLIGYSLGGNMVLKVAGEYSDNPPTQVRGICAVSPSVDLLASNEALHLRSNWIYHRDFLRRLRKRIVTKHRLFPDLYDVTGLQQIRTIREFDERYTAPAHGFKSAFDYYEKASSLPLLGCIRVPTLIIHAEDDPFIPFAPLERPAVRDNPYIMVAGTERGGHVAFVAAKSGKEDRFWAENRVIEFCRLAHEKFD